MADKKKQGLFSFIFGRKKKGKEDGNGRNQATRETLRRAGKSAEDIEKRFTIAGQPPKKKVETDKKPPRKKRIDPNVSRKTAAEIADKIIASAKEKKRRREEMKKKHLSGNK